MHAIRKADWMIPTGLVTLSLLPASAGLLRLSQITQGIVTEENARFLAAPWSASLHMVAVIIFSILGAFQFAPGFRQRSIRWHRMAGRIVLPAGFIVSLSGLWMTLTYPWVGFDGPELYALRILVGLLMTLFLSLSLHAILKRSIPQHKAWMIRAYALGLGAGTQVLTHIPWFLFPDQQSELFRTLCMGAGWGINGIVAECIIRWPYRGFLRKSPANIPAAIDEPGPRAASGARASKR